MKKKLSALLISFIFICSLITGAYAAPAASTKPQTFRFNLYTNPSTLDPARIVDSTEFTVAQALYEGLTRLTKTGQAEPGMAKSWDISKDGKTYTFHLRSSAYWSNNQKVKASDFEYAWKRALNPKMNADYAFLLYSISNAESYNKGLIDVSKVGVKALDDNTLQVTLQEKTAYFLQLLTTPIYSPVPASIAKTNPNWFASAKTLVSNGPFYMKAWMPNKQIILAKNSHYSDAKQIHFTEVRIQIMDNPEKELQMYKSNQIDWSGSDQTNISRQALDSNTIKDLHVSEIASTFYYVFNVNKKPFDNVNIRRAFSMAIHRDKLVSAATPAYGFVPPGIQGAKQSFREEYSDKAYISENVKLAKQLLKKGLEEEGLDELPPVTLISNDTLGIEELLTGLQQMLGQNLGVKVNIEFQEWYELLQNRRDQNYQIARASWGADYNDPSSFLDIFTSWSGMNDSGWSNADYDGYIRKAQQTFDAKTRMELYHKAEQLLLDQMVILPSHYFTVNTLQKSYVQGVYKNFAGNTVFSRGSIK
ncbi:peptide ABC transporter substrate-binding protein [Paenibacillus lignilyticus]|uniref:Peptide ABC transporter substrate-binding protein n=1 Tax=Paenibacillus lignilyticus TaxID=1172615 RepID=A0ABS5CC15_9BACL|nr:peptide ABC transporter substrate-binding protein [Paenibacillus lignilyticus]MBP3961845.1 peptide ABC transporter substrate-binding protein [Paenibacillus lignilyticus]MBP3963484.1 peptide ABC transporter substrate-binding protein [Paenibacillus lignilyticus]